MADSSTTDIDSTVDGPAASPEIGTRSFDPTPYLRQIRGRGGQSSDYLDVRHRLLWLRTVHPDAVIATELIQVDDLSAVFKASVAIPNGGSATGHGSESVADFGDYVEKAETKALGRALNALGFGVQFAEAESEELRPQLEHRQETRQNRPAATREQPRGKSQEWTLFWEWAKSSGFGNKAEVEKVLGKPIDGLSPGELQVQLTPLAQGLGAAA